MTRDRQEGAPRGLAGKAVLITGGGGANIGRGLVLRFAEEGADVLVADIDLKAAKESVRQVKAMGRRAAAVKADVSSERDCERMADAAMETFGRIDVVVASAGMGYEHMPLLDRPLADWRRMLDVNLTGVLLTNRACAKRMVRQRRGGSIVNIASMAAYVTSVGGGHYEAAKAGVIVVTKTLAQELAPHGIRVNAIAPGWTVQPEVRRARKTFFRKVEADIPLGRVGTPREVANVAVFLASDDASYITAEIIQNDGGAHAATRW